MTADKNREIAERLRARNESYQGNYGKPLFYIGSDSILDCEAAAALIESAEREEANGRTFQAIEWEKRTKTANASIAELEAEVTRLRAEYRFEYEQAADALVTRDKYKAELEEADRLKGEAFAECDTWQRRADAAEAEVARLRDALNTIESGGLPNASTLALAGQWQQFVIDLQGVAKATLAEGRNEAAQEPKP